MLTVTRTPLSLVTNRHYAMGDDDAGGGSKRTAAGRGTVDKENASRRFLDDDDFTFRSKNAKTATARSAKTNGTGASASGTSKRKAAAYDEDDDGFAFTRSKPKKSKTDTAAMAREAGIAQEAATLPAHRSNDAATETAYTAETAGEDTAPRPRRRGQKRGIDADETVATNADDENEITESTSIKPTRRKPGRPPKVQKSPGNEDDADIPPLRVEKKRSRQQKSPAPATAPAPAPTVTRAHTPPGPGVTTKIALPFADTPIIRKNQEMRRRASGVASGQNGSSKGGGGGGREGRGSRRSSLGQRGRRASSLIDSGRSSAMPHDAVDSAEFFKHIETALPEPRRMKQLLTWCATRALGDVKGKAKGQSQDGKSSKAGKGSNTSKESQVVLAAREIQSQILRDFGLRADMSDWFDRPEEAETGRETVLKKPNPRNEANERKIRELEAQSARLHSERMVWESLLRPPADRPLLAPLSAFNGPVSAVSNSTPPGADEIAEAATATTTTTAAAATSPPTASTSVASPPFASIDSALLTSGNAAVLAQLRSLATRTAPVLQLQARRRLDAAARDLEFDADRLADSAHVLGQYRRAADRLARRVLRDAAAALDARDARDTSDRDRDRSGSADVPVRDVLRGLSRVERR